VRVRFSENLLNFSQYSTTEKVQWCYIEEFSLNFRDSDSNLGCSEIAKHEKNGFVTATKLGTTDIFFVAATKNFAAATKRLVDRTKHFVVTKCFCYPYFNK